MKNAFRKILSLLLLVSLLSTIACSSTGSNSDTNKGNSSDTTAQKTEDPNGISSLYRDLEDSLPDSLNLGGETIRILSLENSSASTAYVYDNEIWVEDLTSEPLSDSIYNRNMYVMDRLNCAIENDVATAAEITQKFDILFNADEDVYQVIGHEAAPTVSLSLDGYFHDLTALETDYIDFEAPWWSQQFFEATGVNDKIMVLAGALSLSMTRSIHATYFNKRIAEEQNVENLYEVVNDGRWTIDYQIEVTSGMYRDVNGNDEHDLDDSYGFCSPFYWSSDSYWSAFDIDILSKNNDGEFEFVLNTEKAYDGLIKVLKLCYSDAAYSYVESTKQTDDLFTSGRVFMITQKLACAEAPGYRNMQDDYGILPMPKYDKKQSEYYSMPFEIFQTYSIPKTVIQPEMVTAVLEALCAETWRKVIPTYSEMVLKGKYLSDPQSRTMFDKVIGSVKIDSGIMFYDKIGSIPSNLYRYPIEYNNAEHFTTNLASKSRMLKLFIKNLNELAFKE